MNLTLVICEFVAIVAQGAVRRLPRLALSWMKRSVIWDTRNRLVFGTREDAAAMGRGASTALTLAKLPAPPLPYRANLTP